MTTAHSTYCRQQSKKSGSNFVTTFRLLPPKRREALYAFYTICREVDDVADTANLTIDSRRQQLSNWRQEIEACYAKNATHPATITLAPYVDEFAIPKQYFFELIEGVEMDLTINRYPTFEDLYRYCYGVASAVGMICTHIFGCKHEAALEYAEALGIAFQLTNITRDVAQDLERDRIYIPLEDFSGVDYSVDDLIARRYNAGFRELMQLQYDRAVSYYDKAAMLMPKQDEAALLPARLMAHYYRAILNRIARSHFQVLDRRIALSTPYKLSLLLFYWPQLLLKRWQQSPS